MDVPVFVDFMYSNSSVSLKKEKQQEVNELLLVTVFFILFRCLVSALLLHVSSAQHCFLSTSFAGSHLGTRLAFYQCVQKLEKSFHAPCERLSDQLYGTVRNKPASSSV